MTLSTHYASTEPSRAEVARLVRPREAGPIREALDGIDRQT